MLAGVMVGVVVAHFGGEGGIEGGCGVFQYLGSRDGRE